MIKQIISRLWADSLYRNSFWLMAGSFSMAGIGFFYWIIAARLYTPEQIGLATTFLSAVSLISSLAMLGFGTTLIRYLPTSEIKEKKINTAFTVVALTSLVIGLIYLAGLSYWTPKLIFIRSSIPLMILMLLFFPINTINGITDSVFTALRQAHWVFVSNVTQSLTKLVALVLFASLGVWGVIGSNMVAVLVATALCLALIITRFKVHLYPLLDKKTIFLVQKFAFGNYLSYIINILPSLILPIIITNTLSPKDTAYFHMPNMIATLLTLVPSTIARSYFAEISHSNKSTSFKRPLILTYAILLPFVIFLLLFGKIILLYFGADYSVEGYTYLVLISISILISVIGYFLGSILLLRQNYLAMATSSSVGAGINIILSLVLLKYGINGVGIAGIITQICILIVLTVLTRKKENMISSKTHNTQRYGIINEKPKLSVVIVTYNAGEELFDCLESLKKQSEKNFEVILVDNGMIDTDRLSSYDVSYYKSTHNIGPSSSRNLGIQKARSKIVAFLDDDATATVDWVKNVIRSFAHTKVIGIRGKIYPKNSSNILNRLQDHYNLGDNVFDYFVDLEGNSAFSKVELLSVGGFSPEIFGHEGVELCYRLSKRYPKSRILYMPSVVILHDYSDSLLHLVRKALRHGYVSIRLVSKNDEIQKYQKQFKVLTNRNNSNISLRVLRYLLLGINFAGGQWYKIQTRLWLSKKPVRVKK